MIGKALGHYRILEKIGQGGMGEVFLAEDASLHRKVALKFLPTEMQQDDTARKRFIREARSAAALDHPYICHINEVGESEGQDFIAMEYVEGQSLKDRIAAGATGQPRLALQEALQITIEVAEALEAAHGKGIIHRDIKPGNIMLTQTGHAKVMDFGLAKQTMAAGGVHTEEETVTALTRNGAAIGTPAYMSPEQLRGQPADARSDLWALGVTLYEMVAGTRPFQGQGAYELTSAILSQPPRPLPTEVPAELGAVIGRCLEKEPGKRHQAAGELRKALSAVQAGTVSPWVGWRYRMAHSRWPAVAAAVLVLFMLAGILVTSDVGGLRGWLAGRMGVPARAVKLAVLPFANLTGDPEQEYLSDGLTQEMIAQLGRLHPQSLAVIARSSVMRYKKTDKPIDQIGRELGVGYILEGSARRDGGRIRITAELIQVQDQTQLWAETYERETAGILALQSEVARKVAETLALKLLPAEQLRMANVRTVNPEAYDAYLKGLKLSYALTSGDLDASLKYFELAIEKDPNYPLAYAGVAMVWSDRQQMGLTPPHEAAPKAKAAVLKALELDNTLAEAHYALAVIYAWTDWNWPAAEAAFKRAIELDPNFPDARAGYSHYLNMMRRPDEAMAQIERALALDPFNPLVQIFYAADLMFVRRYDDAVAAARNAPGNPGALQAIWWARSLKGTQKEAFEAAKAYMKVTYDDRAVDEALDQGYAQGGYTEGMKRGAQALAARFRASFVPPTDVASLYLDAGDNRQALDWLERGFDVRDPVLPYLGLPYFDRLRSEPRFQALLRRLNLPQ
jgi:serine/threonine-protein kinase